MRSLFVLTCILGLSFSALSSTAHAADIHSFDVIGIKLGMKPDGVRKALQAHNPEFKIEEYYLTYGYSDGTSSYNTDKVLGRMAVRHIRPTGPNPGNDVIIVDFSGRAGAEVATAVKRERMGDLNPPSVRDFVKLLTNKYGPFDANNVQMIEWYGDTGSRSCFQLDSLSETSPPLMEHSQVQNLSDLSVCRDTLTYSIVSTRRIDSLDLTTPVTGYYVTMASAKLLIEKDDEVQQWVIALEEEATAKRASKVEAPKL